MSFKIAIALTFVVDASTTFDKSLDSRMFISISKRFRPSACGTNMHCAGLFCFRARYDEGNGK